MNATLLRPGTVVEQRTVDRSIPQVGHGLVSTRTANPRGCASAIFSSEWEKRVDPILGVGSGIQGVQQAGILPGWCLEGPVATCQGWWVACRGSSVG